MSELNLCEAAKLVRAAGEELDHCYDTRSLLHDIFQRAWNGDRNLIVSFEESDLRIGHAFILRKLGFKVDVRGQEMEISGWIDGSELWG